MKKLTYQHIVDCFGHNIFYPTNGKKLEFVDENNFDINKPFFWGYCETQKNTYYPCHLKFLANGDEWAPTENDQVFENKTRMGYYGYSHRGGACFCIGDTLFDLNKENTTLYYNSFKWRWKFIKALLKYTFKPNISFHKLISTKTDDYIKKGIYFYGFGDAFMFQTCVEDGIQCIVPFKNRGRKIIETMEEAKEAATNFANYLS